MTPFDAARAAFSTLADALRSDLELRSDVERAFGLLLTRYSTKIFENRFIVGGVTERIIAAAFVALGQDELKCGVTVTRADIAVGGAVLSVKGSFQPTARRREIRLVNVMGDSTAAAWGEATIFVFAEMGMGYADPGLLTGCTVRAKDAILLPVAPLYKLWKQSPQYLLPLAIPVARADTGGSDIASRIVADEILRYTRRLRPFDPRTSQD